MIKIGLTKRFPINRLKVSICWEGGFMVEGKNETIVTMDTSSVKFGPGVTQELGFELTRLGVTNVMLVTDPVMSKHQSVDQAILSIQKESIKVKVFDKVKIERWRYGQAIG